MKNRIADYLPSPRHTEPSWELANPKSRPPAQSQIAHRKREVESHVREHPVAAIGTAFCIGVLLAWIIKRN